MFVWICVAFVVAQQMKSACAQTPRLGPHSGPILPTPSFAEPNFAQPNGTTDVGGFPTETWLVPNAESSLPPIQIPALEVPVDRFRKSFFQGGEILGGFLTDFSDAAVSRSQDGGLDETFWEARLSFGVPLGSLDNILAVQPFFRADHLSGPDGIDAPDTLYNTGVNLLHRKKFGERLSTLVIVTPSVRSDFTTSENAFRLFGLAVVNWQCRDDLSLALGAVYFDRADLGVLPAVGLTWTPRPWWRLDFTMPRPLISRRLWKDGGHAEGWAFAGASLAGNTWAVTRRGGPRDGLDDELTIDGIRLLAGYETIVAGNRGWSVEGGFVFNRSIEYEAGGESFDLEDAVFVQGGWKF